MGVLELIQQKSFLGKEFLTWLWFRSEHGISIAVSRGDTVEVEILGPIMLDAPYGDARTSALRGDSPAPSPEARAALLEGKKLHRAKMKWVRGEMEWTFVLDGETFNCAGLGAPSPGRLPFEDYMTMRMQILVDLEQTLEDLLEAFLSLRMDQDLWREELKQIQSWVREK